MLWNGILRLFKWVKPLFLFIRRWGFVEGAGEVLFIRDIPGQGCFEGVVPEDSRRLRVSEGFCEGSAFFVAGRYQNATISLWVACFDGLGRMDRYA